MIHQLKPQDLRKGIVAKEIDWKQIREKESSKLLIGQERALKSLEFGIGNKRGGFNIFVSGYPGSGKLKAVNHYLEEKAKLEVTPGDWCYVNNFQDSFYPKRIKLPNGGGQTFKLDIERLIKEIQKILINAFESKEYQDKKEQIIEDFRQKEKKLFQNIHNKARANNFAVTRTPIEILVIPTDDKGRPLNDEKFDKLDKKERDNLLNKQSALKKELFELIRKNRELERASMLKSPLMGINNRNLKTFETTLDTTRTLSRLVPADRTIVCESALSTPDDLADMTKYGARCFLIGESLMRQDDVAQATRTLLANPLKGRQ